MNEQENISMWEVSFKDFLIKDKRNRTILILAGLAIIVQFTIFKYLYPFASYIHGDSFSYLNAAYHNLGINTYPIGYSKYIRLVSVFAKSDLFLVALQYLSIQASVLFLLFTLFYFYKPGKPTQYICVGIMIANPLFLHLANLISSDNIFLTISVIWFALLIWILHQPSNRLLIWHAVLLFAAFTIRYNALIYPVFSAIALLLANLSTRKKIFGIAAGFILCGIFAGYTAYRYKKLTGHWQYSPFSGWQMANNAMYSYRYVDSADRLSVPPKYQLLDKMIRDYFDKTRDTAKHPTEAIKASTFYMWSRGLPLMKYRDSLFIKDSSATELKKWASMGPMYKSYGLYIIKKYPWMFIRHFIWPNASKYYAPPIEFLQSYNGGKDQVAIVAQAWFGYQNTTVKTRMKNNTVWILEYYPILSGILNVVMLCSIICYAILKGWKINNSFKTGIFLAGTFWLLNAVFTIGASSAALRFQSFPITLTTIFVALLLDWMIQVAIKMEKEKDLPHLNITEKESIKIAID